MASGIRHQGHRASKAPGPLSDLISIYMYQALIQPHFNYCNTVWGNGGITLRNKLRKKQNRAARVLTFSADYDKEAGYLFELLGRKNLARQHKIEKAAMVYKSLHGLAPEYLCSRFAIRETAYNLRDSENKIFIHTMDKLIRKQLKTKIALPTNSHVV